MKNTALGMMDITGVKFFQNSVILVFEEELQLSYKCNINLSSLKASVRKKMPVLVVFHIALVDVLP